jgi:hypothetical protein
MEEVEKIESEQEIPNYVEDIAKASGVPEEQVEAVLQAFHDIWTECNRGKRRLHAKLTRAVVVECRAHAKLPIDAGERKYAEELAAKFEGYLKVK